MEIISSFIRKQPLLVFVILTYGISWILWYLAGAYSEVTINFKPLSYKWLLGQVGTFMPAIIGGAVAIIINDNREGTIRVEWLVYLVVLAFGIVISFFNYDDLFNINWLQVVVLMVAVIAAIAFTGYKTNTITELFIAGSTQIKWILASILVFPGLMIISIALTPGKFEVGQGFGEQGTLWQLILFALVLFAVNLLFGGSLGEEPGWRGLALPLLLKKHSPATASLILALIWAVYDAPIDYSQGFMFTGFGGVVLRIIWTIPLTFIFTSFFMKSNGSMLVALLLHTSVNFVFDFFQPTTEAIGVFSVLMVILVWVLSYL